MKGQLAEHVITRIRTQLSERIGYVLPQEFRSFVVRQVLLLIKKSGIEDPNVLIDALEREETHSTLWRQFISRMTIGESYLFRNPNHMKALRSALLPALIERSKHRPVTIWSAGCSRGEEPYTLAILLHELDPQVALRPISIIATDIDSEALDAARQAAYGMWAFRQTPYFIQRKYFTKHSSQLVLHPKISQMVRFTQHHLSSSQNVPIFPEHGFDLVLCRNVLMYLRQDFRERAGRTFARWLAPEGLLIPGQVERIEGVDTVLDRRFIRGTSLNFPPPPPHRRAFALDQPRR